MQSNSYCKGILCHRTERKHKCTDCGVWVCNNCSLELPDKQNKQFMHTFCIDCFTKNHLQFEESLTHFIFEAQNPYGDFD